MTVAYNPRLPKGLKFYFDVNNPKCIANPGSTTIASGSGSTKLNCWLVVYNYKLTIILIQI